MNTRIFLVVRSIIDKLIFLEKNTTFELEGIKLHPSEIHIILHITMSEGEARNATRIAEKLGVTKGAISHTLSRLERKGILCKVKDPYYKNELILSLSTKGGKALEQILALQNTFKEQHNMVLTDFQEKDKKIILQYLSKLEEIIHK